jgi:hypothetical protein
MSSVDVTAGQLIRRNDPIGFSGDPHVCGQCSTWCAHVHWERRDVGDCSVDPVAVLTSANANGNGVIVVPPPTAFVYGDEIVVVDGGVRVRQAPSLAGDLLDTLRTGTRAYVIGRDGSVRADGHDWCNVTARGASLTGWTAGAFWGLVRHNALPDPA